jgi:hypothetical protein
MSAEQVRRENEAAQRQAAGDACMAELERLENEYLNGPVGAQSHEAYAHFTTFCNVHGPINPDLKPYLEILGLQTMPESSRQLSKAYHKQYLAIRNEYGSDPTLEYVDGFMQLQIAQEYVLATL